MEPTGSSAKGPMIAAIVLAAALVGGGAATYLVLGRDDTGTNTAAGAEGSTATTVLSAEDGAAARARMDQYRAGTAAGAVETAGGGARLSADAAIPVDCGPGGGGTYEPTAEEVAAANADTDALAAIFDTYGIVHTRISDDYGFAYLEWDTYDLVAQSVADSFWADRYPVEPPSQEDLDRVRAENDVVVRYLQEAGIVVTRTTDAYGWESLEYDYENPAAQEAVSLAYAELYPPVPPSAEDLAAIKAENDELAAAFDAAGVSYTRVSDALGWEWLEWDYEDPDTQTKVDAVFNELYPPVDMPCLLTEGEGLAGTGGGLAVEDGAGQVADPAAPAEAGGAEGDAPTSEGVETERVVTADEITVEPFGEPTAEQVARRDAEAAALVAGFTAAGVTHQLLGESPWQSITFDLNNAASIPVVAEVLAARG